MADQLNDREARLASMEAALEACREDLNRTEEEHKTYRLKAQKILSAKEALIGTMKDATASTSSLMSNSLHSDPDLAEAELDQIM
jgi:hypothetical protein